MERKTGSIRKTGTTRKTALVKHLEKGTAPLVLVTTLISVWMEIIGFFSLYYGFRGNGLLLLFAFSVLGPLVGIGVWNRLCKRNKWPFFTGGPDTDPHGPYAFIWGLVTMFPIVFSVQLLNSEYRLNSIYGVLAWFGSKEFGLILTFSFFSGVASVLYYGFRKGHSLRTGLQRSGVAFETFELVMVSIWAVILSGVPTLSLGLFAGARLPYLSLTTASLGYAAPVTLALLVSLLALSSYFYFSDYRRLDPKGMFKGFLEEFGLRCSVFWGLWLLMDGRHLAALARLLERVMKKEFDPIL